MCGNPVQAVEAVATGGLSTVANAGINAAKGGGVGGVVSGLSGGLLSPPQTPGAPTLPQYPGFSQQQQQILDAQGNSVNQQGQLVQGVAGQLGNNQNILQMLSGLFNSDGSVNQNAATQLQQQIQQSNQTSATQGQASLSGVGGTNNALGATSQAYTQALQGGAPANQQMQFQQTQNFNAMKEQAAQQGIQINGDNWANATSSSTAGQKLLQNMQQNNNIQNQNYNLGYIGQLSGNMGQLAGAGQTQANTGMGLSQYSQQTPTNYLQQSITNGQGALAPMLQNYQTSLTNQFAPYQTQQMGQYQQQMAQQQANYQAQMQQYQANQGFLGGIGSIAGTVGGALIGGPAGAMIGGQMGGMLGGQPHQGTAQGTGNYFMLPSTNTSAPVPNSNNAYAGQAA